jgi:hypothetical protein
MKLTPEALHDLSATCTDFQILLDLIRSGYRFDDAEAPDLIQQLENDLKVLKNHLYQLTDEST